MRDEPFDILTLNETRLDSSILDCEVQIPGYDIIRSDRNRYGGGVAIYIRTIIPYIISGGCSHPSRTRYQHWIKNNAMHLHVNVNRSLWKKEFILIYSHKIDIFLMQFQSKSNW